MIPSMRAGRVGAAWSLTCAVLCLTAACVEEPPEDIPTPPNMAALVSAYESPQGSLTAENAPSLAETLAERLFLTESTGNLGFVGDLIGGIDDPPPAGSNDDDDDREGDFFTLTEQPLDVGGTEVQGEGFVRLTHTCKGWDEAAFDVPDAKNGRARLVSVFGDNGFNPVVWGALKNCKYLQNDLDEATSVLMDSAINVHTGEVFTDPTKTPSILFELAGNIEIDGEANPVEYDFRTLQEGALEIRLPVPDGEIIFHQGADGSIQFRASNGNWLCNTDTNLCSNGSLELPLFSF